MYMWAVFTYYVLYNIRNVLFLSIRARYTLIQIHQFSSPTMSYYKQKISQNTDSWQKLLNSLAVSTQITLTGSAALKHCTDKLKENNLTNCIKHLLCRSSLTRNFSSHEIAATIYLFDLVY